MAPNLSLMLKNNGINISAGMSAEKIISLLSKLPQYLILFPGVNSAVQTLQTVLNAFNTAKSTLASMQSTLEQAEEALNKAQQLQTFIASQAKPIVTEPGKPCVPDAQTGVAVQTALQMAQQLVDKAKENVAKAEAEVEKAKERVTNQIDTVVKKIFTEKLK